MKLYTTCKSVRS